MTTKKRLAQGIYNRLGPNGDRGMTEDDLLTAIRQLLPKDDARAHRAFRAMVRRLCQEVIIIKSGNTLYLAHHFPAIQISRRLSERDRARFIASAVASLAQLFVMEAMRETIPKAVEGTESALDTSGLLDYLLVCMSRGDFNEILALLTPAGGGGNWETHAFDVEIPAGKVEITFTPRDQNIGQQKE